MSRFRVDRPEEGPFRLSGTLSFATVPEIWKESRADLARRSPVEVDLGGVDRSDSAGLALLVAWAREARRRGTELRLHNWPRQLLEIARVSRLEAVLHLPSE